MQYKDTINFDDARFKRLVGIKRQVFHKILDYLKNTEKKHCGPKNKLTLEEQLLMTILYAKDYKSFASVAFDFNISESNCWQNITKIRNKIQNIPELNDLLIKELTISEENDDTVNKKKR